MTRTKHVVAVLTALAAAGASAFAATPDAEASDRPRDPWVFRSVLDKRPRMITIALDEDLWLAYDAQNGGLYRAWKGGVEFTGPVYDTRHGPQPRSLGEAYQQHEREVFWTLMRHGRPVADARVDFRGYELEGTERVTLHHTLGSPDGTRIDIRETPSMEDSPEGPTLVRRFEITGIPPDHAVTLFLGDTGEARWSSEGPGALPLTTGGPVTLSQARDGVTTVVTTWPAVDAGGEPESEAE